MIRRAVRRRISQFSWRQLTVRRLAASRLAIGIALSLALLLAQAGAFSHFYSHATTGEDPTGLSGGQNQVCAECLSFAPLLSAGGTSEQAVVGHAAVVERISPVQLNSSFITYRHVAFRSRAPPSSLPTI